MFLCVCVWCVCVCARPLSLIKPTSTRLNQVPVHGSRRSSCLLIIHVCLFVCLYMCVWKCAIKVMNIKKDKFLNTLQSTIRIHKTSISVSVFRTLGGSWIVFPSLPSWFHYHSIAPALTLCERVFFLTSPYTCMLCPIFSVNPSVVGIASPCTCWRKDRITWSCASHTRPVSHDQHRVCLRSHMHLMCTK